MPIFGFFLRQIIYGALAHIVIRITSALGLGFFTYKQIDKYIEQLMNYMTQYLTELPLMFLQLMRLAEVDTAISIICSAFLTRVAFRAGMVALGVKA